MRAVLKNRCSFGPFLIAHQQKGRDLGAVPKAEVQMVYDELSRRPRERLGWRTPYEAYHSVALHLL